MKLTWPIQLTWPKVSYIYAHTVSLHAFEVEKGGLEIQNPFLLLEGLPRRDYKKALHSCCGKQPCPWHLLPMDFITPCTTFPNMGCP